MQRSDSEGYLTNRTAKLFLLAMNRAIRPHGLTAAYVPVLYALNESAQMTQAQLSTYAGIEQPTMAATLKRMERDGLLDRTTDTQDRRKSLITLSAPGREKVAAMMEALVWINGRATQGLDSKVREEHRLRLKTMIGNLETLLAEQEA